MQDQMKRKSLKKTYAKYGYAFITPFCLIWLIFSAFPIVYTIMTSFTDLKGISVTSSSNYIGLGNYASVLNNKTFWKTVGNTWIIWLINFIPQFFFGLLLAVWFTQPSSHRLRGKETYKLIMYMPNLLMGAAIGLLFQQLFEYPVGTINQMMNKLGIESFNFGRSAASTRITVGGIYFWQWYGQTMIMFVAGIKGINPTLFEAAFIDGANGKQAFFHITLPSLRPIILYILVTCMAGGMQNYDIPLMFSNGGPNNATRTITMFIINQAFKGSNRYGFASATSVILFIQIVLQGLFIFLLMREKNSEKRRI